VNYGYGGMPVLLNMLLSNVTTLYCISNATCFSLSHRTSSGMSIYISKTYKYVCRLNIINLLACKLIILAFRTYVLDVCYMCLMMVCEDCNM